MSKKIILVLATMLMVGCCPTSDRVCNLRKENELIQARVNRLMILDAYKSQIEIEKMVRDIEAMVDSMEGRPTEQPQNKEK